MRDIRFRLWTKRDCDHYRYVYLGRPLVGDWPLDVVFSHHHDEPALYCDVHLEPWQEGETLEQSTGLKNSKGGDHLRTTATASLDRIDSSKGYAEGNVQWVDKDVNIMKRDMTERELFEVCRDIVATLGPRYA